MNKSAGALHSNSHCLVNEREISKKVSGSQLASKNESADESDSTDSDESETTKADSCKEESVMETDSCSQSRISSRTSTLKKEDIPSKWFRKKTNTHFSKLLRFFGRRKQKLIEKIKIPEENEYEETKSLKSRTQTNAEKDRDNQSVSRRSDRADKNTWEHECENFIKTESSNFSTFQPSERSLVSKKIICCSTCSSPMVIHEIILANPPDNTAHLPSNSQTSRICEDSVLIEDGSEKSLLEDEPNCETYIMEESQISQSSEAISEDTESSTAQSKHSTSVETPQNESSRSHSTSVQIPQNESEISEVCKMSSQNVINEIESLQKTGNEDSDTVTEESTQDDSSLNQECDQKIDSEEPDCKSKIDSSSETMTQSDSEKIIAKIDYTEELSSASKTTTTTTTSSTSRSTLRLDKNDKTEVKSIDTEESDGTIVGDQFLISDQSIESHQENKPMKIDRYSSFKKKYIPVRSNCDTSSSLRSGPDEETSNTCMPRLERTDYLFYPRKFSDPVETDKAHTVMWVSHHYSQMSPKKIEEKASEFMDIMANSRKNQGNSMRYCAPKDILEMTLGRYQSKTLNSRDFQNKSDTLDLRDFKNKSDTLDLRDFQNKSDTLNLRDVQNKCDSIQNIYLNKTFYNQLESNEDMSEEFECPKDIKINGVVYNRQFHRDYIPIKLKSEYKWKLFARRTIYSRSKRSVHSSRYSKTTNRNKEKNRKTCNKKYNDKIKSPNNISRVSLTESANDEEDCRTLKEQLSKISICFSDFSDE